VPPRRAEIGKRSQATLPLNVRELLKERLVKELFAIPQVPRQRPRPDPVLSGQTGIDQSKPIGLDASAEEGQTVDLVDRSNGKLSTFTAQTSTGSTRPKPEDSRAPVSFRGNG